MADGPTWRVLLHEASARLGDRGEARRLVETASGDALPEVLDRHATKRTIAHFDSMLERRLRGEPLQYVLGGWGFRGLDVLVDRRVLIPRPETEIVVEHALAMIDALDAKLVVDLGTGSGVIALSIAHERTGVSVWATDVSGDALDVARANLAGIGRSGRRVQLAAGEWFDALPADLAGTVDVIVSNPPYVAASDDLPSEVRDWEPVGALVAGPRGTEAIEVILEGAQRWLRPGGALVIEIGETQAEEVVRRAREYRDAVVHADLAGRPRVFVGLRR